MEGEGVEVEGEGEDEGWRVEVEDEGEGGRGDERWRVGGGGWMVERVQMFNGTSTAHDFLIAKGVFLHS